MTDREQRLAEIHLQAQDAGVYGLPMSRADVAWLLDQLAERDRELAAKSESYFKRATLWEQLHDARTRELAAANKLVGELAEALMNHGRWGPNGYVAELMARPAVQEALKARQS